MWVISDELKTETVAVLRDILIDDRVSARDRLKAAEVLGRLDKQNTASSQHLHLHGTSAPMEGLSFDERQAHLRQRIERLQRLGHG